MMKKLALLLLLLAPCVFAQTPVALIPAAHQQFFSATGVPLAGGCVSTFVAGTSTPQATYTDVTGMIQNANPLTLDSGGFATIYLANQEYKIQVNAAPQSGACSSSNLGAQIWVQDNVSSWQILNNIGSIFFAGVTSDPTGTAGEMAYRSDLPCFRGFTTIWDCFVMANLTQTLTNKTLTTPTITSPLMSNPTITGGGSWTGSPSLANPALNGVNAQTGTSYTVLATDEQKLITFNNTAATGVVLPQATTTGFGSQTKFNFRNLGTGLVTITPTTSTIDGAASIVLALNQGIEVYSDGTNYWTQGAPPNTGYKFEVANLTPATVANTTTPTNLITYTVPANEIGIGQTFFFDAQGIIGDTSAPTFTLNVVLDGTTICSLGPTLAAANNQPWALKGFFTGLSTGTSGSVTGCHIDWSSSTSGGGHIGNETGVGAPAQSVTVNTTVSHTLSFQITWGTANTLNTVTQNSLILYRIG